MRKYSLNNAVKLIVKCRQTIQMLAMYKFLPLGGRLGGG